MCAPIVEVIEDTVEGAIDVVSDVVNAGGDLVDDVGSGIADGVQSGSDGVVSAAGNILEPIMETLIPTPTPPPSASDTGSETSEDELVLTESSAARSSAAFRKKEGLKRTGLNDQSLAKSKRKGAGQLAIALNTPQPSGNSLRI